MIKTTPNSLNTYQTRISVVITSYSIHYTKLYDVLIMDLTDHKSIREAVRTVVEKEGRIDVLINNAGMHTGGPVETLPSEFLRLV